MFDLTFASTTPIIVIDNSYYVFNRYYATLRWFKQKDENIEIDHKSIIANKEFIIAFIKHFEADIKKLTKKFKTIKSNLVFCIDCPRSEIWRNDIYDKYKQSRIKKDNFNSDIFELFEDYLSNNSYKCCKYDKLEADDIVYLIQNKLNKTSKIVIITNDGDYLQMYSNNVKIFNMQFKDLSLKINYSPSIELLLKIIMGDKSDNISKIQNGMRKDNAIKIALMNDEDRNIYLNKYKLFDAFKLNKTLIDFNEIPESIVKNFYEYYNISIQ